MKSADAFHGLPSFFRYLSGHSKGGRGKLPEENFTIKDLGSTIAKMLGLAKGDTVELARSKIDRNKLLVIKRSLESKESADAEVT